MKIGVLGVGAIGGIIGGYLARANHDVTLIDQWPANVEHIKANGITVTTFDQGPFTAQADALHLGEVAAARPSFDVVVLSVKSYDTLWAAKFIEPYLAPGGYIMSAQNSINEDAIASVVGWPRVTGCVVTLGAAMYEPGRPERTSASDRPAFALGEPLSLVGAASRDKTRRTDYDRQSAHTLQKLSTVYDSRSRSLFLHLRPPALHVQ